MSSTVYANLGRAMTQATKYKEHTQKNNNAHLKDLIRPKGRKP